ncbi:transglutaminase domain-containing protein [Persicobacter psychrovividus]|uniref:Transglutaminase-like domain-containing protein n=1 Tax=Persicobacter psychrovividus TaxID=387638 RepID=A0ABM7VI50_9BACT|nr:hypothetical protein PEPS_29160 [Persicobacter psychrovividus]
MRNYLLLIFYFFVQTCYGQSEPELTVRPFGEIKMAELEMTQYDADPEAKGLILFDEGTARFVDGKLGYEIEFTRHKVVKVFDKHDLKCTEVEIPLYLSEKGYKEKVVELQAVTYNLIEGKIVPQNLVGKQVYMEKVNDRWINQKFVFPNVQNGAIIEYEYTVRSPFMFNLPNWNFQSELPTLYSSYCVRLIPAYEYVYWGQGMKKFDIVKTETGKKTRVHGSYSKHYGMAMGSGYEFTDNIQTFVKVNVPAMAEDIPYLTSRNDQIMRVNFQLSRVNYASGQHQEIITTWPNMKKELLQEDRFGKILNKWKRPCKQILENELPLSAENPEKKAQKIIEYVKNNYRWNHQFGKFATQSPKELLQSKTGNSADLNLFLISLLRSAKVEATPVLISTRQHGAINRDYPFLHMFNNVVVLVKTDRLIITDATDRSVAYHHLPVECINAQGLLVDDQAEDQWLQLNLAADYQERTIVDIKHDAEADSWKGVMTKLYFEYAGAMARKEIGADEAAGSAYFEDDFEQIELVKTRGIKKTNKPFTVYIKGEVEAQQINEMVLFDPFLNQPIREQLLKQEKRDFPVDFIYQMKASFTSTIHLPEGYRFVVDTKDLNIDTPLLVANLSFDYTTNKVVVQGDYAFKKDQYSVEEYATLKALIDDVLKGFSQKVVLERIKI